MEGGVEAGDLGQLRAVVENRLDGRQVVGLVQRRQGSEAAQAIQHITIDPYRLAERRAAMHHPVSDQSGPLSLQAETQGQFDHAIGRRHVGNLFGRKVLGEQARAIGQHRAEPRTDADAVQLAVCQWRR